MALKRMAQIETTTKGGIEIQSVVNIIAIDDGEYDGGSPSWGGYDLVDATAGGSKGDDYEDGVLKGWPRIDSISPTSAVEGDPVTVTGRRLDVGSLTILIGGVEASNVRDRSYTSATADVPAGVSGLVDVKVQNGRGEEVLADAVTVS